MKKQIPFSLNGLFLKNPKKEFFKPEKKI